MIVPPQQLIAERDDLPLEPNPFFQKVAVGTANSKRGGVASLGCTGLRHDPRRLCKRAELVSTLLCHEGRHEHHRQLRGERDDLPAVFDANFMRVPV